MTYLIFILGLIIGSFLNVVIYRIPKGESIIYPPSYCPNCQTRLTPLDLIPILSFLFTKGRCRYCQVKISYQYPVVELLTGVLFFILFLKYQLTIQFGVYSLLISLLIVSSLIDLKYQIIPNRITYFGIIVSLIMSLFFNYISFNLALLGMLIPGGFLLAIAIITKGGMGIGDVKFVAMIGAVIGAKFTLIGIFLGSLIGSIFGILLISLGFKSRKDRIAFGPLLALGSLLMILWGEKIINWYIELLL